MEVKNYHINKIDHGRQDRRIMLLFFLAAALLFAVFFYVLLQQQERLWLLLLAGGVLLVFLLWALYLRYRITVFTDELCETLDQLSEGGWPGNVLLYEDSLTAKVENRLSRCYDMMRECQIRSKQDKETIQSIVSDISHQVKTPVANIKMFSGLLQQELPEEKRREFFRLMDGQIEKLDFLMQSLIKMSRLETGTFSLHMEKQPIYQTIALAVEGICVKADKKGITLEVDCDSLVIVNHDRKWTAEALMNILDNAVKYTPPGGKIHIRLIPWQFYTRIDIQDNGMGIREEEYHKVFQRFYRTGEAAGQEGVGLGLYLAQGIVSGQKGYISVRSGQEQGTVFSVNLLS